MKRFVIAIVLIQVLLCGTGCEDSGGSRGSGDPVPAEVPAAFTSAPVTVVPEGGTYSYSVTAEGNPEPDVSVGTLPAWLSFDGDTLSGTAPLAPGTYGPIHFVADNGIGADTQDFSITVQDVVAAPSITSSPSATFVRVSSQFHYVMSAAGDPEPTFSVSGNPAWMIFNESRTLHGTPGPRHVETSSTITITASNGVPPDAVQTFEVAVRPAPYKIVDLANNTVSYAAQAPADLTTSDTYVETKMVFKLIEAGSFQMGDLAGGHHYSESPVHPVNITRPFYMGVFEVTHNQLFEIDGTTFLPDEDKKPVTYRRLVHWDAVQSAISDLSSNTGDAFRLPTEAEWEYACRAGTTTMFSCGDTEGVAFQYVAHFWYQANSMGSTHQPGQKLPNPWGLYDMHGNVREACSDYHYAAYYAECLSLLIVDDPQGPTNPGTEARVTRGGSHASPDTQCRSAARMYTDNVHAFGYRLVSPVD